MKIELAPEAERDLTQAVDFVARDSPRAADRVKRQLLQVIDRLAAGELRGPEVMLSDGRPARRWPAPPYVIYYRRAAQETEIVRIYHQARRPIER